MSRLPLTLSALEAFFNQAWPLLDVLEANFADSGYDLERMLAFVVGVESEFYPQIGELYTQRKGIALAIAHLERALEKEPEFTPAIAALGLALRRQGDGLDAPGQEAERQRAWEQALPLIHIYDPTRPS